MAHASVLGVYAHPDDADVGAGGTLARFVRQGARVALVLVTSGGAGGNEDLGPERVERVRRAEQRAAAAELGVTEVTFLSGFADGHVREGQGLVRQVVAEIRRHAADLVLTTSPEYNFASTAANHPDHLAVGRAVVEAAYPAAGNPFDYPDLLAAGLEPHEPAEVWFQGHKEANHWVAITADDVERKVRALRCHVSQFHDMDAVEAYVRQHAAEAGPLARAEAAEAFFRWVLRRPDGTPT